MNRIALVLAFALAAIGCVRVRPWQREKLAAWCMDPQLSPGGAAEQYRAKMLESRSAGGAPGSAPGGGCGCTQ